MTRLRKRFSRNLKNIRENKGLTQEKLAERLGVSTRYLQRLEGNNCPNVGIDTLAKLAKALRVKPVDFLVR